MSRVRTATGGIIQSVCSRGIRDLAKGLEIIIDDEILGIFVPPAGGCFSAILGNVPKSHIRVQVCGVSDSANWYWQLPDLNVGQIIAFRMVETSEEQGVPPQRVVLRDPAEGNELAALSNEEYYNKVVLERKRRPVS